MGLQPPPELATLANIVFSWPLVDEVVLHQAGSRWISFAVTAARVSATATTHAARTVTRNDGEGVRAFDGDWQDTARSHAWSPLSHLAPAHPTSE
ncbi:hypothetical protein GCM10010412_020050 [Nonomuraea recticatena]|uniref:Uncharacterized protein n=2 Tax=Nonomuraea recticatena TaxID=46178 RepID=A0ABP6DTY4_9ACTN